MLTSIYWKPGIRRTCQI